MIEYLAMIYNLGPTYVCVHRLHVFLDPTKDRNSENINKAWHEKQYKIEGLRVCHFLVHWFFLICLAHINILIYTFKYYNSLLQFQQIESLLLMITGLLCHLYNCAGSPRGTGKRDRNVEMHLVKQREHDRW